MAHSLRKSLIPLILFCVLFPFLFAFVGGCSKKQKLGNTLRLALRSKYKSIDPAHGGDYYSNIEIARAYEGLLQYNYVKRPYVIEPNLAEEMPAISKDKKCTRSKLKKAFCFKTTPALKMEKAGS